MEALTLLEQYDIHFSIGAAQHVSLSDASGRSVAAVAQSNFTEDNGVELTCWSLVYNQQKLKALFYDTEDWAHPYTLSLSDADWLSK